MSLYYEAVSFLSPTSSKEGSLKSRIFKTASNLKSSPATIYALISETAKYNSLLKEVIDNAGLLALESKVWRPSLLVHFDELTDIDALADTYPVPTARPRSSTLQERDCCKRKSSIETSS
jgi:hypothetical protein